jgi:hypothetical protein
MSNDKYIGLLDIHRSSAVTAVNSHQDECVLKSIIETKAQTIGLSPNQSTALSMLYLRKGLKLLGFTI